VRDCQRARQKPRNGGPITKRFQNLTIEIDPLKWPIGGGVSSALCLSSRAPQRFLFSSLQTNSWYSYVPLKLVFKGATLLASPREAGRKGQVERPHTQTHLRWPLAFPTPRRAPSDPNGPSSSSSEPLPWSKEDNSRDSCDWGPKEAWKRNDEWAIAKMLAFCLSRWPST
jgi:hypothetical protein